MAHDRDQVFGVAAIENREGLLQSDPRGIFAQQPRADAVERARPLQGGGRLPRRCAERSMEKLSRPALHLRRRPARERQQQNALRIGAAADQVRDAVGERVGLAGAGAGDDQQRSAVLRLRTRAVLDRESLLGVEGGEEVIGMSHGAVSNDRSSEHTTPRSRSPASG